MTTTTRWMLRTLAAGALAITMLAGPIGCSTNPATGETQLNFISAEREIKLGEEAQPQFIKEGGGQVPDERIVAYVRQIGQRLASVSERKNLPWEFHVLNSPIINAFALPGGKVFITRGLLERMTNEAQLAGVLGHEVGHVTAEHIGQRMSQAMVIQGFAIGAGVATDSQWIGTLGGAGGSLYLLKFGRDQESQSDMLGVRYMTKLNYDPMGQVQVMQILRDASKGKKGIEFLQTHPLPDTRIKELKELIKTQYPHTQNNPAYTLDPGPFKVNVLDRLAQLPPAPEPKPAKKGKEG